MHKFATKEEIWRCSYVLQNYFIRLGLSLPLWYMYLQDEDGGEQCGLGEQL